jgi:N-acetylmuramoyl-L-alanine amidase
MAGIYVVRQGDHLSSITKAFGFSDYKTIWEHPHNANLKQKRQNPNILLPGDSLFIPDRETREESRSTNQHHKFVRKTPMLQLRLTLEDLYEKPIANAACLLAVGSEFRNVTTDGNGKINEKIPPDLHEATLLIRDSQTPIANIPIPIKIGRLDPVDAVSGQIGRLNNLGYFAGNPDSPPGTSGSGTADDGNDADAAAQLRSAIEEFQCDQGLTVDGICGSITQAALKKAHGC